MDDEKSDAQEADAYDPLERYLELCQSIYERMEREGSWPWKNWPEEPADADVDSTAPDDLIESEENPNDV